MDFILLVQFNVGSDKERVLLGWSGLLDVGLMNYQVSIAIGVSGYQKQCCILFGFDISQGLMQYQD